MESEIMNIKNIIDGIAILRTYFENPDGYHLGAEHDEIFIFKTDHPMSPEDVARVRELGWFQTEAEDDEEDGAEYSAEEAWCAYV